MNTDGDPRHADGVPRRADSDPRPADSDPRPADGHPRHADALPAHAQTHPDQAGALPRHAAAPPSAEATAASAHPTAASAEVTAASAAARPSSAPTRRGGSGTRIRALVVKEFRHLIRDKRVLATVLLMPIMQLLLFSYAISFDVRNVPTMILDQDHTVASRTYVASYTAGGFFTIKGQVANLDAVDGVFDRSQAEVVIVIPPGFQADLDAGRRPQVAILVDGSDPNSARIGEAYAIALNQLYGRQLIAAWADVRGVSLSASGSLEPRVRTWYNPDLKSSIFLIPGLVVVILMIVTVQQTAVSLVRERDLHTQEQLVVSPLSHLELVVGKLLPWTLLGFGEMVVTTGLGMLVFGVPLRGSILLLATGSVVFVFSCLAIGLIISTVTPSMETANVVALMLAFLPGLLLSGLAFPLDSIPRVLQVITYLFPGRYMVTISRGVFLKGVGFAQMWPVLLELTGYALVLLILATRLYARKVRS